MKKQQGFSLIELSMVIAVIALLTIAANFAFNSIRDNLSAEEAVQTLEFHMVTAVQQCQNRRGNLDGCDGDAVIALSPIDELITPWGEPWAVVESGSGSSNITRTPDGTGHQIAVAVTYDFDSNSSGSTAEDVAFAADMADKLNAINGVRAAVNTANTEEIFIDYYPR